MPEDPFDRIFSSVGSVIAWSSSRGRFTHFFGMEHFSVLFVSSVSSGALVTRSIDTVLWIPCLSMVPVPGVVDIIRNRVTVFDTCFRRDSGVMRAAGLSCSGGQSTNSYWPSRTLGCCKPTCQGSASSAFERFQCSCRAIDEIETTSIFHQDTGCARRMWVNYRE